MNEFRAQGESQLQVPPGEQGREDVPLPSGHHPSHAGRRLYTRLLALVIAGFANGFPALDVGCGTGLLLTELARMGITAIGIDKSAEALRVARDRGVEVRDHDANQPLPFDDGKFGVVVFADVIEHLRNPSLALAEARRVLDDHGKLVAVTINAESPLRQILGPSWAGYKDPEHVELYGPRKIRGLAKEAGFTSIRVVPFLNFAVAGESTRALRWARMPGLVIPALWAGDSLLLLASPVDRRR